ncbi:hypothetical protein Goshw_017056 [Gossypium schwendimanii]|uniref:Stomagen C-terminal domain-containing protein n=1 Tax=Gossypium schwendimanii TaxID=34291 RepID=A0A7J9KLT5_GOSSC|nr:hypothetical protein [Gossypium schwendimanii]
MANIKLSYLPLLLFTFFLVAQGISFHFLAKKSSFCFVFMSYFGYLLLYAYGWFLAGSRTQLILPFQQGVYQSPPLHMQATQGSNEAKMDRNSRRLMIGSTAPTCTFNECRGCKYKCRAEQVPVEGNDPINSAYHYKCVCHRS